MLHFTLLRVTLPLQFGFSFAHYPTLGFSSPIPNSSSDLPFLNTLSPSIGQILSFYQKGRSFLLPSLFDLIAFFNFPKGHRGTTVWSGLGLARVNTGIWRPGPAWRGHPSTKDLLADWLASKPSCGSEKKNYSPTCMEE